MTDDALFKLKHKIADMLTISRAGISAARLEVRLLDGTHHEIVGITYPDHRNVLVFLALPLDYEQQMTELTRLIHEERAKAAEDNAT